MMEAAGAPVPYISCWRVLMQAERLLMLRFVAVSAGYSVRGQEDQFLGTFVCTGVREAQFRGVKGDQCGMNKS